MRNYLFILSVIFPLLSYAEGNIDAGKTKSQACIACHGPEGISVQPAWPNLAGQHASYIFKQLVDFKTGKTRLDPGMTAIASGLSKEDMEDLAIWYASLSISKKDNKDGKIEMGAKLYRAGDASKQIIACIACHGPAGKGNAQAGFPALAGQKAAYTITQMLAFKKSKRTNDVQQTMRDISQRMEQQEIEALAYYLEGL